MLQSHLQALHSMILAIYILTPFTMASTLSLFQGFRIIQTRMMVLSVIHGLRPNQQLKAILEGCGQSQPFVGIFAYSPQPFCANIFPVPVCLHSFHTYYEHATQILYWVRHAPHPGSRIQSLQKTSSPRTNLSKLNWLFATGRNTTICTFGLLFSSSRKELITDVLNSL